MRKHLILFALGISLASLEATELVYRADADALAPDPTQQGWEAGGSFLETESPAFQHPPYAAQEAFANRTYNAWVISNLSPAPNDYTAFYTRGLDEFDIYASEGWTVTAVLRVASANSGLTSQMLRLRDGHSSWEVAFVNDAKAALSRIVFRDSDNQIRVLADYPLGEEYFTFQMVFNPAEESMQFHLNGEPVGEKLQRWDVPSAPATQKHLSWGDRDISGRAVRTEAYWHLVELKSGQHVANSQKAP